MWEEASGLLESQKTDRPYSEPPPPVVIVDSNVRRLHQSRIEAVFSPEKSRIFEVPSGESSKSIAMWKQMIDFSFSGPLLRNTPFIAIGGGVTGDLAGYVASSLMRGLPLYHIPTTLLAMVDSAIGGKTGINHPYGKNTIGAFYHPKAVIFDSLFLDTLPQREWLCGLSEILKYGYIADPDLIGEAALFADPRNRSAERLQKVILKSVQIKADIVREDSREGNKRAWLNFGHTFAHALEAFGEYGTINHGEAVYTGMIAALYIARKRGADVSDQPLLNLKKRYRLDLSSYTNHIGRLVTLMQHDKKNRGDEIRLVLLEGPAKPTIQPVDDHNLLAEAWEYTFDCLK